MTDKDLGTVFERPRVVQMHLDKYGWMRVLCEDGSLWTQESHASWKEVPGPCRRLREATPEELEAIRRRRDEAEKPSQAS